MKIKILLVSLIGLILVGCLSSKDTIEDGFTHRLDFENKLKEYSNGMIEIEDSNIEYRDKENDSIYKANWKGFEIFSKVGKSDWVENSYAVATEKQVFEDKTAYEQYHKLMECLICIADPKLSMEEIDKLIAKGVEENDSPNDYGFSYERYVGQDPVNNIRFTIVPKGGW